MKPGVTVGDWAFWSIEQGLTPRIEDVSADEGGNVYVAGRAAVFAKRRGDDTFRRFDARSAGLTENCHIADPARHDEFIDVAQPPVPPSMCPAISVAGSTPGKAILGFKGVGTDDDYDAPWTLRSGGADVVTFDGEALRRERHVLVAGPPGTVCEGIDVVDLGSGKYACREIMGNTWVEGRLKLRQVQRIIVNHGPGVGHGDAIMGGTHASFTVLVANPEQRGWEDKTAGHPGWEDARYVFEHQHPANDDLSDPNNPRFLSGDTWALAIDPRSGVPWFANQHRLTNLPGYATRPAPVYPIWEPWWGNMTGQESGYLTLWVSAADPAQQDAIQSLSFCDDGTLWAGSLTRGLAGVRVDETTGAVISVRRISSMPAMFANRITAVACDVDGKVWVGSEFAGILRYDPSTDTWQHGTSLFPEGVPEFAWNSPVRSIQIDRWSRPRVVYFAHHDWRKRQPDGTFAVQAGGVTAYAGE
jgi:hypothetical protein